jgi:molecular chaperone Hsp33
LFSTRETLKLAMIEQDCLRRFLFEQLGVRGEWVKLTNSWQDAKRQHDYPLVVQQQLGQAIAAVSLLSATIKYQGSLIIQAQGDGPLQTVVAQCTDEQHIRGWARYNDENLVKGSLQDMFGSGRLVLTIKSNDAEPYQGIVPLVGDNLSAALEGYFMHSEQLKTRLWLTADAESAAGFLLQELPSQQGYKADWQRIETLAATITEQELMTLSCEDMLFRLFNQEQVRLFDPQPVLFKCQCSLEKITATLFLLGRETLEDILQEQGEIKVDCEFCSHQYHFDKVDVEKLLNKNIALEASNLTH